MSAKAKWRARLAVTRQSFGGKGHKNEQDCKVSIASMFEKQVTDWSPTE